MPIFRVQGNPTNPNVPTVGFADNFNRSDGPLGFTPVGLKPYIQLDAVPTSPGVVRVVSNRAQATSVGGFVYQVLECYESNGTLTATAAVVGNRQGGLAVRAKDANNLIRLALRLSAAGPTYTLQLVSTTVAQANLATSSVTSNNGDTIAIVMDGPSIKVIVNGTEIMSASTPHFVNETKHGMSFAQTDVAIDNLAFAAA
ncbi:hypothetical protein C5E10_17985 [Pseudoclavibacter sp. RFBG4]|uniref:hypothetical protein n=1 Tax=Pseudoclavibacter sp. RFBG4 TaxID=2080575 RepID=UPI000CE74FDD|nr:hypothetical protein [Pseudoclavibacter sp. RFBG4]PPG25960.1 hypothetical protein C5E10_17985 [Pseudoclavibacter sp. RFBG4]